VYCKYTNAYCIPFHQAFRHIFTSPSSVDREPKATRAGNARLHGMTAVTGASIAYVTTQVFKLVEINIGFVTNN
jgi:hypothetical protein